MFKFELIGNLTGDPQIAENRATFTVAARTHRRNQDNTYKAEFVRCTIWGKAAETVATYCHKGDRVYVSGHGYSDEFVGRDGATHWNLQCDRNTEIELLGDRRADAAARPAAPSPAPDDDDVLPD